MLNSIGNYYTSYPFYNGLNSKRYDVVFQENYDTYLKQYALNSNPVGGGAIAA